MTEAKLIPVILSGGNGTRLWPRSRASRPKPFIPLLSDTTLFEQAIERCPNAAGFGDPIIVTGAQHLDHVKAQLNGRCGTIIVEPMAQNTAAAIALAATQLPPDAVMLVCPSDHHIGDRNAFISAATAARALAERGLLVAFGIEASRPETGFGYLLRGDPIDDLGHVVAQFVEKPDLETARGYLADGRYSWNGGIFAFRVAEFWQELRANRADIAEEVEAAALHGHREGPVFYPDADHFRRIKGESIDYAVMEKTKRAAMVAVEMGWSDIGNWAALRDMRDTDSLGNHTTGAVELVDCENVMVDSDGPTVSVIGARDLIVVVDGNDILITTPDGAQRVGKLKGAAIR